MEGMYGMGIMRYKKESKGNGMDNGDDVSVL
jgi:hypothetical protein